MKYKIIALFGESGSGKDYIQKWMCAQSEYASNCNKIISYTTRPKRDNEEDGVDYHFIDNGSFSGYILEGNMLEITSFNDWHYGTAIDSLKEDKVNIGVFNIAGIRSLLRDSRCEVLPIYIKCSNKTRLLRALNREQAPNCHEICRRFLEDEKDFENIPFDYETYINIGDLNTRELELLMEQGGCN